MSTGSPAPPAILQGGFRLFFLGGALWAAIVVLLWVCALAGDITLPIAGDAMAWHWHEMLFGYLGAVIAGFLLTAIANWTGRAPLAGWPVAALFGLWLAARLALLFSGVVPPIIGAVLDVGMFLALLGWAAREIVAAGNRNKPILIVLLLFAAANAADHAEALGLPIAPGLGMRAGLALVALLITIIGGRIVPTFTRNWLSKAGKVAKLPPPPGIIDKLTIGATLLALAGWAFLPDQRLVGAALILAAGLQLIRLARWGGVQAWREPIVVILHIGYLWIPAGLALLGASLASGTLPSSAIHALAAGAMGTMTLAIMTRATLGHTGRALVAGRGTIMIYALVTIGALLRVAAPVLPLDYMLGIELAALSWCAAFLVFVWVYAPILAGTRVEAAVEAGG